VRDVGGGSEPKGRHISPGELAALIEVCVKDQTPAGIRDAAIIALAWATGGRRSELANLAFSNYIRTGDDEGDLRIWGKGDKPRVGYIFNGAAAYLHDWLAIRGDADGPLFYAINKGGNVQVGHGVSDEALAQMLEKRCEQAGVKDLTWHDFRRTFAGNLLDNGHDLVTVQKLMGHSSPTTTANYDRRGDEAKRRASRSLHVPYRKRG
jgi:site-specific recombinase XerD